jgi:hypothetical protein
MENFDDCISIMKDWVNENIPVEDSINSELRESMFDIMDYVQDSYVLIAYPEYKLLMNEAWFMREAIQLNELSKYFVPLKRLIR